MYADFLDDILTSELNEKKQDNKILDVGCGNGKYVNELCEKGFDAFGTGVEFKPGPHLEDLLSKGKLQKIQVESRKDVKEKNESYVWPFADSSFDSVSSRAVVEHVKNLGEFISENKRITKPGGYSVHYFPSIYSLIEPHVGIPFGGIIQNKAYYFLCCKFGLSYSKYRGRHEDALNYVKNYTSYRKLNQIIKLFESDDFEYCGNFTKCLLKHYKAGKYLFISKHFILLWLFRVFRSNILVFKRK